MRPTALLARVTAWPTFAFAIALASAVALAASPFEGKWKVQDTKGNPFEITLSEDGSAHGSRSGEGLSDTWKAEGDSAVITWQSGWTTEIKNRTISLKRLAFDKGKAEGQATDPNVFSRHGLSSDEDNPEQKADAGDAAFAPRRWW